ncbi:RloB family protein [Bacteroidota bacterium]
MNKRRRRSKNKPINPTLFVFCEGESEEKYISYLKRKYRFPTIVIDSKIAGHRISERYIRNYKKSRFTHPKDRTFLFYDVDDPRILRRISEIKNAEIIASNPCFELWYLLHFQEQNSELSSLECRRSLTQKLPDYRKGRISRDLKQVIEKNHLKAMNRARKLKLNRNPSCSVYKFIEELERIKKEVSSTILE